MIESVFGGIEQAIATHGLATVLVFVLLFVIWKMYTHLIGIIKENNAAMLKVAKALNKIYGKLGEE